MSKHIQAVRGMNDILPVDSSHWQQLEDTLRDIATRYAFKEIRFPILEKTALFKRTIGEVTDIIEKEMYSFEDRNGDNLSLRPEGTAGCVRAGIEHSLFYNQTQKLWYMGPCYRHERPQKGRYRQFHQFGAEVFGIETPDADAELIAMSYRIFQTLGLQEHVTLELNTMGSVEARASYRKSLVAYFSEHQDQLDEDSERRLHSNPLRILDSKNPTLRHIIENAPKLLDHLDEASHQHFEELQAYLHNLNIPFKINPTIVRGLDYYNRTVFEWTTDKLGAQNTLCAGGRYDGLVAQLGGQDTPAVGFALGIERMLALLEDTQTNLNDNQNPDIFIMVTGEKTAATALSIAQQLREQTSASVYLHCGGGSLKSQFKKADKSLATFAIVIGNDEVAASQYTLKYLREDKPQETQTIDQLIETFNKRENH